MEEEEIGIDVDEDEDREAGSLPVKREDLRLELALVVFALVSLIESLVNVELILGPTLVSPLDVVADVDVDIGVTVVVDDADVV